MVIPASYSSPNRKKHRHRRGTHRNKCNPQQRAGQRAAFVFAHYLVAPGDFNDQEQQRTAATPFSTAAYTSAFTGSIPTKLMISPMSVAMVITP